MIQRNFSVCMIFLLRKKLFVDTVPTNDLLFDGTVPKNNLLFVETHSSTSKVDKGHGSNFPFILKIQNGECLGKIKLYKKVA